MRTTAIKYQDRNQNEVLLATSDTLFTTHFLQKKRQVESSGFRSNHNVSPYNYSFSFTGKEWCKSQWLAQRGPERGISETGYSYFGARYYDSDLCGLFISIDPKSDKYPSISPYAYCAWNPVKLVDRDGRDTINIDLDKGTINLIKADGDHSILYYKNGELASSNLIEENKVSFFTKSDEGLYIEGGKKTEYHTVFLQCSSSEIGEMIFKTIAGIDSPVEWDYYALKRGYGELSSSGIKDRIIHPNGMYTHKNVEYWDHFHPYISSDSFFPSYDDQDHAKELKGSRCTIYCNGCSMDFGSYVPSEKNGYINLPQFRQLWNRFAR